MSIRILQSGIADSRCTNGLRAVNRENWPIPVFCGVCEVPVQTPPGCCRNKFNLPFPALPGFVFTFGVAGSVHVDIDAFTYLCTAFGVGYPFCQYGIANIGSFQQGTFNGGQIPSPPTLLTWIPGTKSGVTVQPISSSLIFTTTTPTDIMKFDATSLNVTGAFSMEASLPIPGLPGDFEGANAGVSFSITGTPADDQFSCQHDKYDISFGSFTLGYSTAGFLLSGPGSDWQPGSLTGPTGTLPTTLTVTGVP